MIRFKDLEINDLFKWKNITFEKVILSEDIFGSYNAISRTAPTGNKVKWFDPNTIVEKVDAKSP